MGIKATFLLIVLFISTSMINTTVHAGDVESVILAIDGMN